MVYTLLHTPQGGIPGWYTHYTHLREAYPGVIPLYTHLREAYPGVIPITHLREAYPGGIYRVIPQGDT